MLAPRHPTHAPNNRGLSLGRGRPYSCFMFVDAIWFPRRRCYAKAFPPSFRMAASHFWPSLTLRSQPLYWLAAALGSPYLWVVVDSLLDYLCLVSSLFRVHSRNSVS